MGAAGPRPARCAELSVLRLSRLASEACAAAVTRPAAGADSSVRYAGLSLRLVLPASWQPGIQPAPAVHAR